MPMIKLLVALALLLVLLKIKMVNVLKPGDPIYFGDKIIVENKSKSQILLLDETVLTLGQKSTITIDDFVYDPSTNNGKILTN